MVIAKFANYIGILGVVIILISYLLLQCHQLRAHGFAYCVANMLGSGLILFSLYFAWNLPAVIVEGLWCAISIFGAIKALIKKQFI